VEFSLVQKDVLFGLQQGTKVLQAINKEMGGIEGVEKLMGETEEARAYQEVKRRGVKPCEWGNRCANHMPLQEISQMLAGQLSNQDEDEVEDELEKLRQETEAITLPKVPTAPPVVAEGEEEGDQEEVEISAARMKTRTAVPAS
jgi:charged multivesicular body protein 6